MILYRWQGEASNFGDELNTIVWPRLLPDLFDDDPAHRFLGIGSVFDARHPPGPLKLVAGAGFGGYERKPVLDSSWIIHWVRGPRTAAELGLPSRLALGDPAVLLPHVLSPDLEAETAGGAIGFMPHFESAARGAWREAAAHAGIRLIDPREAPSKVLRQIAGCRLLLSEALHGVIVADALRVPWIAIRPRAPVHRAKWADWADTMDLRPRFRPLPASSVAEWAAASVIGGNHNVRAWFERHRLRSAGLVRRAGDALAGAAWTEPQLSSAAALERCQSRMLDAVQVLARHPFRGMRFCSAPHTSALQRRPESAYQLTTIG